MKDKRLMIVLTAMVFILASFSLDAGNRSPRQMKHMQFGLRMAHKNLYPGPLLLGVKDKLALNEAQVQKIETLYNGHKEIMIKQEADLKLMLTRFDAYLNGEDMRRPKKINWPQDYIEPPPAVKKEETPRAVPPAVPAASRIGNFNEVEQSLSPEEAQREAGRCERCDLHYVNRQCTIAGTESPDDTKRKNAV